jgi:hypothetical protein
MPKVFIQREIADNVVMGEAMRRLEMAGNLLASKIEQNLLSQIKNPNYSRPPYKGGYVNGKYVPGAVYAGKWWTARDAGELLRSVRVVKKEDSAHRNIWVITGNSKAYYAAAYEYSTDPKRGKKFYRPALASSRSRMKSVIENG